MARAPAAAATPPDDDDDAGAGADTGADQGDQDTEDEGGDEGAGDEEGNGETVEVTITSKGDGTYMVYAGDEEPEEGEAGEGAEGDTGGSEPPLPGAGGGADTGAAPSGMDEGAGAPGQAAQAPQHCDSIGAALKAAADILHDKEGGEGGGEAAFQSGFGGDATKPTMQQKY